MHQERTNKRVNKEVKEGALPSYLLDREKTNRAKVRIIRVVSAFNHIG